MIFKLIIFLVVIALIYRWFGGKLPFIDPKPSSTNKEEDHDFGKIESTSACATCGVYITEADAIIYQRKAYCSQECLQKAQQKGDQ